MIREIKELVSEIKGRGWEVVQAGKHLKARKPGCGMVTISLTPKTDRGVKNARADISRAERAERKQ